VAAVSFGYEILVTPLQMLWQFPHLRIRDTFSSPDCAKDLQAGWQRNPGTSHKNVRQVIKPETAAAMVSMLENVVLYGTAQKLPFREFRWQEKTGTAEKFDPQTGR